MAPYRKSRHRGDAGNTAIVIQVLLLLVIAIIFGGSSRPSFGNMVVQLASLPLLGTAAFILPGTAIGRDVKIGIGLLVAAAVLPLLYAIPLPPALWTALPGRELAVETYQVTDIPLPWHGAGIGGGRALSTAMHVLPALAMFCGMACLSTTQRWRVIHALLILVAVSVILGLAQIFGGQRSWLRFYDITSLGGAAGFFANRNHQATLMLIAMPLSIASAIAFANDKSARSRAAMTACWVAFALIIIGLAAARSRAGIIIGAGILLASGLVAFSALQNRMARTWLAVGLFAGLSAGIGLAVHSSGTAVVNRLSDGVVDEGRLEFATLTMKAASDFAPLGSGPGTFEDVYHIYEPVELLRPLYVNHAHNEYIEIWLEYGVAGIVGLTAFLAWLCWTIGKAWWPIISSEEKLQAKAGSIAIIAVLTHSLVDYPLRTSALAVIMAITCALLVPLRRTQLAPSQPSTEDQRPTRSTSGHRNRGIHLSSAHH